MARLPKATLSYNERNGNWKLTNDSTDRTIKVFPTKEKATQGGALKRALGPEGGSVKIQKVNGRIQEERTFPRSADPRKSRG